MTVHVGNQIQAEFGVWAWDNNPTAISYQWQDSLNGTTVNGTISGAVRSDYIAVGGDVGHWVRCMEIASNAGGNSAPAYTAWVGPIEAAPVVGAGSRKKNRRTKGGSRPSGRIRRTVS